MFASNPAGPTLLGFDILWVATMLSAVAMLALLFAIYMAMTVRDPMAKRVKALNERREQLKAGIVTSTTKRRAKLNQKNETTDKMRSLLSSMRVLQDSQLKQAQVKLMQAGIRSKDAAVAVIFSRLVLPIVIGGGMVGYIYGMGGFADYTPTKRYMIAGKRAAFSSARIMRSLRNSADKTRSADASGVPYFSVWIMVVTTPLTASRSTRMARFSNASFRSVRKPSSIAVS